MLRATPYAIPDAIPIAVTEAGDNVYLDEFSARDESLVPSPSGAEWFPFTKNRFSIFIAGVPNAGKSYFTAQLLKLFPETYEVLLFTDLEENDANFKDIKQKVWKIKMKPEILKKINMDVIRARVKNPICVFDDIDKMSSPTISKLTKDLLHSILLKGRGHDHSADIHCIVTYHALNGGLETKTLIENCEYLCLFPLSTLFRQMEYFLSKVGLKTKEIHDLVDFCKKRGIRKIIIKKTAPLYIITQNFIKLI